MASEPSRFCLLIDVSFRAKPISLFPCSVKWLIMARTSSFFSLESVVQPSTSSGAPFTYNRLASSDHLWRLIKYRSCEEKGILSSLWSSETKSPHRQAPAERFQPPPSFHPEWPSHCWSQNVSEHEGRWRPCVPEQIPELCSLQQPT